MRQKTYCTVKPCLGAGIKNFHAPQLYVKNRQIKPQSKYRYVGSTAHSNFNRHEY
jgi:hypothetical protein